MIRLCGVLVSLGGKTVTEKTLTSHYGVKTRSVTINCACAHIIDVFTSPSAAQTLNWAGFVLPV